MSEVAPAPVAWKSPLASQFGEIFAKAGIWINGDRPWDIQIKDSSVFERIVSHGSLGLGEAYMDGHWDADQLDEFFARILRAKLGRRVSRWSLMVPFLRERLINRQSPRRAWRVGEVHYDLGNDFYQAMLGPHMTYTCGYWKAAEDLDQAQQAKLELICQKLQLESGMRLLDIGCGWGGFMAYAAKNYGVECVGVSISREQVEYARRRYAGLPLDFRLQDYRDLDGQFDRIASIGMFEHVGKKNYRTFMKVVHRCLTDDGIFLLHTIGKSDSTGVTDPWMDKYIFPNGELPAINHISEAVNGLLVTEDLHNFGADYDKTLMQWHANFAAAWPGFADTLGERFYRQWQYYLLSCAGGFRARDLQLWQWTLSRRGILGGCPRLG